MAKMITTLTIKCATNPDWNGSWDARDIKAEMEELGMVSSGNDWIEYVIGHLDFPAEIDDMVTNDMVTALTCNLGGDVVKIIKQ